jgi:hypothetical protein
MTQLEKKNMAKSISTIESFIHSLSSQELTPEVKRKKLEAQTALRHLANIKESGGSPVQCHDCNGNQR